MKGYTLVELMIVISTIAVLSMMGIIGLRGASEREQLAAASRQLLGDLISTQNKASSGYKKAGFSLESLGGDSYKIYAYHYDDFSPCGGAPTGDPWEYDCPGGVSPCQYCKEEIGTFYFNTPPTTPPPRSIITIKSGFSVYFFRPPNMGRALINDNPAVGSLEIVLEHTKLPFTKKVKIEGTEAVKIYEE